MKLLDWKLCSLRATPPLSPQDVHLWLVSLEPANSCIQHFAQLLSADELARAARFYFDRDRNRFTVCRGVLRTLLSSHLQVEPKQVQFAYGAQGKPQLGEPFSQHPIQFNVSHSGTWAIVAIALNRSVGVDLEQIRSIPDAEKIASRYFSPMELATLQSLPVDQQQTAFFQYWTGKEAYVKASGEGLARSLTQVEIRLSPEAALARLEGSTEKAQAWSLQSFSPVPEYAAAAVVQGQGWQPVCFAAEVKEGDGGDGAGGAGMMGQGS